MKAIYKGKLYRIGDNQQHIDLHDDETGATLTVPWADPELIVDPTDDEINNILPYWSYYHPPSRPARADED